jgi:hypothetical protein
MQYQSYRSVKIEKSHRVVESRPVCLDLLKKKTKVMGRPLYFRQLFATVIISLEKKIEANRLSLC